MGSAANPIRYGPEAADVGLPAAPPVSPDNLPLVGPSDRVSDCTPTTYQWPAIAPTGVSPVRPISATSRAKTTPAADRGVLRAVTEHGAQLLAECRVLRLEADRTQVRQVIAQHRSGTLTLQAKVVVLAAGALATPVLFFNSRFQ